jgi:hypothetical protein
MPPEFDFLRQQSLARLAVFAGVAGIGLGRLRNQSLGVF